MTTQDQTAKDLHTGTPTENQLQAFPILNNEIQRNQLPIDIDTTTPMDKQIDTVQ